MQTISLAPGLTLAHTVYAAGLLLLALAAYRMGGSHPYAILRIVAVIITLACLYGVIQFAMGNGYVLWLPKTSYINNLSGTFINRNSFATLAGMGMLANFGIMLQRVGEVSSRLTTRQRFKAFWLLVLRPGWVWMSFALICFIALLLTASRAGITASLCGVMVLFGSLAGMREAVRWPLAGIITVFVSFAMLMLAALGADLGRRLLNVSEDASLRQGINIGSTQLIEQFWLTGTGLGSYMHAFFTVHTPESLATLNAVIDHAHNTYLELAVELGLPIVLLSSLALVGLAIAYMAGLGIRRRAIMWPALGVSTLVLVGGHALADFSLSTPAFAAIVIIVLMLALAQSFPSTAPQVLAPAISFKHAALLVPAILVGGLGIWQSAANYHAFQASATLRQLAAGQPVGPGAIFAAQRHLMRCVAINPLHPTCREDIAQTHLSLATGYGFSGPRADVGMVYLALAKNTYQEALAHSPVNPLSWYRLARIEAFLGNRPQAQEYLANSIITGGAEPKLAMQRIPLMLEFLPEVGADNASLFTANILGHWASSPWPVTKEIKANPGIQQRFAQVLGDTPEVRKKWNHHIRTPFPQATATSAPLGEDRETR